MSSRETRASQGLCASCGVRTGAWLCRACAMYNSLGSPSTDHEHAYRPANYARHRQRVASAVCLKESIGWRRVVHGGYVKIVPEGGNQWAAVPDSDPRWWCMECIAYMKHRDGCPRIEHDGSYVDGYDPKPRIRFGDLRTPDHTWTPGQLRKHLAAIDRRWSAFVLQWTKVSLLFMSDSMRRAA